MRQRRLKDNETGQTWSSLCDDVKLTIRSGQEGKERTREKVCETPDAALRYTQKEELTRLKKGWTLSEPGAPAGQPVMHCYLPGNGYTGAMAIAAVDDRLLCNRFADQTYDWLHLVGADGTILDTIDGPKSRLTWAARYLPDLDLVLLRTDHQITALSLSTRIFKALTQQNPHPVSCFATSGVLAAWYEEPEVVVRDLREKREIFRTEIPAEMDRGSVQMCAGLSADGSALAVCSKAGVIEIFDLGTGKARAELRGGFKRVVKLEFFAGDRGLIAVEDHATSLVWGFDLDTLSQIPSWPRMRTSGDIALDSPRARLAVANESSIELYELAGFGRLLRFEADHVVRRCSLAFAPPGIGVLTDLGCVSLYSVA